MKKSYYLVLVIYILAATMQLSHAQTAKYTVKTNLITSPWQLLDNATPVLIDWHTAVGTLSFTLFPIQDQHFDLFGISYVLAGTNTTWATKDGFLLITSATDANVVSPFFAWLDSLSAESKITYRLDVAEKDTILWVDWANMGFKQCSDSSFANFRLAIHSQTGEIEFLYGPSHISCDNAFGANAGPQVGMFRSDPNVTTFYDVDFLQGKPASPKQNLITNPALGGVPEPGRRYVFSPIKASVPDDHSKSNDFSIRANGNILSYSIADESFTNSKLRIFDVTGKTVLATENLTLTSSLSFNYPPGVYMAELQLDKKTIRAKFIKSN
jgi:hypothetical protein